MLLCNALLYVCCVVLHVYGVHWCGVVCCCVILLMLLCGVCRCAAVWCVCAAVWCVCADVRRTFYVLL